MNKLKKAENFLLQHGSITIRDIQNHPINSNGANKIMQNLKEMHQIKEDWIEFKDEDGHKGRYKRFTLVKEVKPIISNVVNGQTAFFDKSRLEAC